MAKLSNTKIRELDAVRSATVREVKMSKHVNNARVKVWSSKCIKWDQECINKCKSIAINVKERDKLLPKVESVRNAKDKKFLKRPKLSKSPLKRVYQRITQLLFQEKEMNFLKQWPET